MTAHGQRYRVSVKMISDYSAIAVLHTHSRELNYHPHIHLVMPAAAVDKTNKLWRTKQSKYLFNHKALAKVFRAKMLTQMTEEQRPFTATIPKKWIVDCKFVGASDKALIYLGRYLYRGVIREKDILSCQDGNVTYRYQDSKTKRYKTKTVSGLIFYGGYCCKHQPKLHPFSQKQRTGSRGK